MTWSRPCPGRGGRFPAHPVILPSPAAPSERLGAGPRRLSVARGNSTLRVALALALALALASTAAIALPAARIFLRGAMRAGSLVFPGLVLGFLSAELLFQLGDVGLMPSAWPGPWLGLG